MHCDSSAVTEPQALLRAVGLTRHYRRGHWFSRAGLQIQALRNVDVSIRSGSTLGVIGLSGAGKSTLARCLSGIEQPDSGEIWFDGVEITRASRELLPVKRRIQMVFQEAAASLNPRLNALEIVSEPLLIAGEGRQQRREKALELMQLVGLAAGSAKRLPSEFSSGQRRRLALARALTLEPKVLILDESLAGLDLSIQAQISNLLLELQTACSLTYICISHDLNLVAHLSDEIAVMDQGRIVDVAASSEFLSNPSRRLQSVRLRETSVASSFGAGSQ